MYDRELDRLSFRSYCDAGRRSEVLRLDGLPGDVIVAVGRAVVRIATDGLDDPSANERLR